MVRICASYDYEDALNEHIVMELYFYAGGELLGRIMAKGHYTESIAAQIIRRAAPHVHTGGVACAGVTGRRDARRVSTRPTR
jgi:hypothetical protein